MLFDGGFTFTTNFLADIFSIFFFCPLALAPLSRCSVICFRRHDVSGVAQGQCVVILLIVLPYIGVFAYILTQDAAWPSETGSWLQRAHDQMRQMVGFQRCRRDRKTRPAKSEQVDLGGRVRTPAGEARTVGREP